MNAAMQSVVTFVIVAVALGYATFKFMPQTWRLRLASGAASLATRIGLSDVVARRVEARMSTGGACGSCDSCKACATPAKAEAPEAAFEAATPSRFRRIPIRRT